MPGRPIVALCAWADFNYDAQARALCAGATWLTRPELPTACRASLGGDKVTIWLPGGARVVKRHRGDPWSGVYRYVFGSHDRGTRTLIRIRLTELPHA